MYSNKRTVTALVVIVVGLCTVGANSAWLPPLDADNFSLAGQAADGSEVSSSSSGGSEVSTSSSGGSEVSSSSSSSSAPTSLRGSGAVGGRRRLGSADTSNGIQYQGGPVMLGPVRLYYIWYGDHTSSTREILTDFGNHLGGSRWYKLLTTYTDGNGTPLSSSLTLAGSVNVGYTRGKVLAQADVQSVVQTVLTAGQLPTDASAVYLVLTARDVQPNESGFCGYHSYYRRSGGVSVKYGLILNPAYAAGCDQSMWNGVFNVGPNGDASADRMASVIAHEVAETVTDPELNAWLNDAEIENGDLCNGNVGVTYPAANLAAANIRLGNRDFLLQQLWVNANGGSCQGDARSWAKATYGRGVGSLPGCGSNEDKSGLLCYPKCRAGYSGVGPVCWGGCPSGYTDTGALCTRCTGDWRPWTWHCDTVAKDSYGRGVGSVPHGCPADQELNGALCYPRCRAGYKGVGPVCWQECPADYRDMGAFCSGAWN